MRVTPMKLVAGAPGWHAVICSVATMAVLGTSGCNKAQRHYPTTSAVQPDGGSIGVHGDFNHCPSALFFASPDHTQVGRPITLTAIASDEDNDPFTYSWSATSGSFASTNAMMTTFVCSKNGSFTITLSVSDWACTTVTTGSVICQPPVDGGVDGS